MEGASDEPESASQPYEPWLFQTMLDELSVSELGIGFIYSVLDLLVERYALSDAVVILVHESFGAQMFRLRGGGRLRSCTATPISSPSLNATPCVPLVNSRSPCTWPALARPTTR